MAGFLVESYVARSDGAAVARGARAARLAAAALAAEGTAVVFLRALFVPHDETCLLLYEAESVEAVRAAVERAGLAYERIAEAVDESGETRPPFAE